MLEIAPSNDLPLDDVKQSTMKGILRNSSEGGGLVDISLEKPKTLLPGALLPFANRRTVTFEPPVERKASEPPAPRRAPSPHPKLRRHRKRVQFVAEEPLVFTYEKLADGVCMTEMVILGDEVAPTPLHRGNDVSEDEGGWSPLLQKVREDRCSERKRYDSSKVVASNDNIVVDISRNFANNSFIRIADA